MDEKIQDNSIFEAELSDCYREELLTDIPDIWDKINARLDSVSAASAENAPISGGTGNVSSNISSAYIPVEETAPVIRYNKAAAKSSHSIISGSALMRFVPIAAAVVVLCICVPVFIKLQHNGKTESAVATADNATMYEKTSDSATLTPDSSTYNFSSETKTAGDDISYEDAFAEEATEYYDNTAGDSDEREAVESVASENSESGAYIMIYVVPDTDYSRIEELISAYNMDLESDSSDPNAYKLFPGSDMDLKELSGICDEIRKYDFIIQATPVAQ